MVLGKFPVPGRPTIWITEGKRPVVLAVGAGGGCLDIFTLVCPFSPLSPSLWETARYRLKYCLKGPLNPKLTKMARYIWLKFVCSISRTLMLIGIRMKKMFTELGHSDHYKIFVNPSKIYVNSGNQVHSNDLFSEITAPTILKFHMQHDKAAGL